MKSSSNSLQFVIRKQSDIPKSLGWADANCRKAITAGNVVMSLGRENRNKIQNDKLYAMCGDFEKQNIEQAGRNDWTRENWKCFFMSAYRNEVPAVGLLGEPVSMCLQSSGLSKKDFSELIEFIYAAGSDKGVKWSEKAQAVYDEYKEAQA